VGVTHPFIAPSHLQSLYPTPTYPYMQQYYYTNIAQYTLPTDDPPPLFIMPYLLSILININIYNAAYTPSTIDDGNIV